MLKVPVNHDAARRAIARLLAGQPEVPARSDDSEHSERGRAVGVFSSMTVPDVPRAERGRLAPRAAAQLDTSRASFSKKEQLGTYFSISAAPLDGEAVSIFADDPGAHVFRREVAGWLAPWWARRAVALLSCGEAGARCDCGDCGSPHVLPYRCGARSCPTCAHAAAAVACERVAQRAESALESLRMADVWEGKGDARRKGWKLVTLTTRAAKTAAERYEPDTLKASVKAVRKAVGPFWRSTPWGRRVHDVSKQGRPTKRARRDTVYVVGIEVAPGGMVHVHMAVFGEYVASAKLAKLWADACVVGGFVNVKALRVPDAEGFRKSLREVLKYVSKGDKEPGKRAQRAATIEYALKGVRRVEMGGALRMVPKVTEKDVATRARVCEACGGAGSWRWRGMRAPDYVRRNNGFGLSHIVDDADAALVRARTVPELRSAHRTGGLFYGGSPPPWMDDPEEWETVESAPIRVARRQMPISPQKIFDH